VDLACIEPMAKSNDRGWMRRKFARSRARSSIYNRCIWPASSSNASQFRLASLVALPSRRRTLSACPHGWSKDYVHYKSDCWPASFHLLLQPQDSQMCLVLLRHRKVPQALPNTTCAPATFKCIVALDCHAWVLQTQRMGRTKCNHFDGHCH
jgi:hypothetical protein